MTDRHKGYLVTLNKDIREDDSQEIINAIMLIKGVRSVLPYVADAQDSLTRQRVKNEMLDKIYNLINES